MEGWRVGGLEGWKVGGVEGWKVGGVEGWKGRRVEGWRVGGLEGWKGGVFCVTFPIDYFYSLRGCFQGKQINSRQAFLDGPNRYP